MLEAVTTEYLATIHGGGNPGYDPQDDALGRAGPSTQWGFLGNYYTPEALTHDQEVRANIAGGDSHFMAHLKALPELPAAIGSYFRARFFPGKNDMQIA